jgi:hypothetical protein
METNLKKIIQQSLLEGNVEEAYQNIPESKTLSNYIDSRFVQKCIEEIDEDEK